MNGHKSAPPMSILLAVSSLSAGGAERMIAELANAWAGKGRNVAVLTLAASSADHYALDPRVQRIALDLIWESKSIWQSVASNIRRSLAIRRAVQAFAPDVVVSFIEQTNVRVLAALMGKGIPVIVSERTDPRRHRIGAGWERARRWLYPHAARTVVQTGTIANWAAGIVPPQRIAVLPNFVRALPEPPAFESREAKRILAVGRLDRYKGFDLLLRAFARSGLANKGVGLTILGEGPKRQALEALAREFGIAPAVEMPGVVQAPERWMARCTVFVLPSRYEGFPNALLEAMAMGCPVIAADCNSGPREIVRDGEDGLLVSPENVDALAEALVRIMGDADLRLRLGTKAIEVRERFGREHILARWEALLQEALEEKT